MTALLSHLPGVYSFPAVGGGSNLILNSDAFDTWFTNWTHGGNTAITANQIASPNGTGTVGDVMGDDSAGGSGATVYVTQDYTFSASTQYCFSIYAQAKGLSWFAIEMINFTDLSNAYCYFDVSTGTKGVPGAGTDASGMTASGLWYRCYITFTTAADTTGTVRIWGASADGNVTVNLNGTSDIYLTDAQLETGASPTAYTQT